MPPTPKKGSILGSVKAGYKALTAAAAYTDKLKQERLVAAAKAKAKAAGKLIEGAAAAAKAKAAGKLIEGAAANKKGATSDSTKYYTKENDFYWKQAQTDAKFGYRASAEANAEKARKLNKDILRQQFKGEPGYDKNGFPIKKNKVGGAIKKMQNGGQTPKKKSIIGMYKAQGLIGESANSNLEGLRKLNKNILTQQLSYYKNGSLREKNKVAGKVKSKKK